MTARRIVHLDDHAAWPDDGETMQFRLTYEGPLPSSQGEPRGGQKDPRAVVKHQMRKVFHRQLKRLWAVNKNLNGSPTLSFCLREDSIERPPTEIEQIAAAYSMFGWNFVPLVTETHHLLCSLDILFLRPSDPGKVIWAGDIDNRLKTLFDALKIPDAQDRYGDVPIDDGERPFFCLLEDDKLITRVAVETDQMLEPVGSKFDMGDVRLIINVELRPYFVNIGNSHFS